MTRRSMSYSQSCPDQLSDMADYSNRLDCLAFSISWSKAQLEARSHPAALEVQKFLLSLWNKTSADSHTVSFNQPLSYADRLRIRRPGDSRFALGPHCDGGSVERWEDPLYRQSYKAILEGRWREHDPWDIGKFRA
jgi:hypothetical protein